MVSGDELKSIGWTRILFFKPDTHVYKMLSTLSTDRLYSTNVRTFFPELIPLIPLVLWVPSLAMAPTWSDHF